MELALAMFLLVGIGLACFGLKVWWHTSFAEKHPEAYRRMNEAEEQRKETMKKVGKVAVTLGAMALTKGRKP